MNDPLTKTCTKCDTDLPIDSFYKQQAGVYGVRPDCKSCVRERRIAYYYENQEKAQAYSRQFYADNTGHIKDYQRRYIQGHQAKIAERYRAWREPRREQLLEGKRQDYIAKREHYSEIKRQYNKANPQQIRASTSRRRARKANAPGNSTAEQWIAKCSFHGWQCYLCHTPLTLRTTFTEHRTPLCRGGSNWPANLAPACKTCNSRKHKKTEKEYRQQLAQAA